MGKIRNQTLALASLIQTTALVDQLALTGKCDSETNKASLKSIITTSSNIEDVFGSIKDLSTGLNALKIALGEKFLAFLQNTEVRQVFKQYGFEVSEAHRSKFSEFE